MSRYDVLVVEEYTYKGESRRNFHKVGRMIPNRGDGYTLFIPSGVSVSGRLLVLPQGKSQDDLHRAYRSLADTPDNEFQEKFHLC